MEKVYLLLGSNLGNRKEYLDKASEYINREIGKISTVSSIYETASWGKNDQPDYLNQVVLLDSALDPGQILEQIILIEKALGRVRTEKWASRTIDIDILFYGNQIVNDADLIIPHPQLHLRRFTLAPLNELAPNLNHPVLNKSINDLFCNLNDTLIVSKIENNGL